MIDYASVKSPFSDDLPCGPDLDLQGDDEFLNYVAGAEGRLPASFFAFSRDSLDIKSELQAISQLLERTHDIRLLTLAAKFSILSGDLIGFADAIEAISFLLTHHWKDVHPCGIDDDFTLRKVQIESLDDMPTTALPLQYAPLVRHRRHGTVSLRSHLIALGEVQPREGETALDSASVRDALLTSEDLDELKTRYQAVCRLELALNTIPERYMEETGYTESLSFERLPTISQRIRELIEGALEERDPSAIATASEAAVGDAGGQHDAGSPGAAMPAAAAGVGAPPSPPARPLIRLESLDAAVNALQAAERYFAEREPSNPSILLIRQARQLVGKSFIEAMQLLVPTHIENATIQLGGPQALAIPITQLGTLASTDGGKPDPSDVSTPGGEPTAFSADSRLQAVDLMAAAERYFVEFEPSSPVPVLLGRARSYVDRDFFSLLNEFAPPPAQQ